MFVAQGMRQFEIWTGKPAPVADMAFAVTTALQRRGVLPPSNGDGASQTTAVEAVPAANTRAAQPTPIRAAATTPTKSSPNAAKAAPTKAVQMKAVPTKAAAKPAAKKPPVPRPTAKPAKKVAAKPAKKAVRR
jgi:3-dehydroquinate dehydratase/shikimate dehydrogenase